MATYEAISMQEINQASMDYKKGQYTVWQALGVWLAAGAPTWLLGWKNSYWGIAAPAYYTLVTVAAVAFVWFRNYWNLLGWRF